MPGSKFTRRTVLGSLAAGVAGAVFAPNVVRSQSGKPIPVTIANAQGSINVTMQEIIKQKKFLEEFGLEPNIIGVADGARIASGLFGGSIDVSTMSGFGQMFPAIEKGAKIKILAGGSLIPTLAMFSANPSVKTLKDLEGKTVGTGSIGALVHQLTVTLLRKYNVDTTKIRFVNIGNSVDIFKGVTMKTVDAGAGDLSFLEQQDKFGIKLIENGIMATELPEYTYQGAWTTDDVIEKHRDKLVRTLAAYAKLYRYVQTPAAKDDFLRARKTLFNAETPEESTIQWNVIQKYKPYAIDLVLSEARLNYMQQLNIDTGTQATIQPFSKVADMSLARDAIELLKKQS